MRWLAICAVLSLTIGAASQAPIYKDKTAPVERRVEDLLSTMTPEEKISLLGGTGFATKPVPRLDIPELTMTDGPLGARWEQSIAYPGGVALAATWDVDLAVRVGGAIAQEARAHGRDVLLGPCVNIQRVPQAGRNFESFSEDPWLASRMAVAYINGVQQQGVVATVKHFAANNQETDRMNVDTTVGERALREIYLPAFKAAVQEAGSWAVMSAYNKLNGAWCSENRRLLTEILKEEWGFKGLVMSDWGAVHSTVPTVKAGMDLEMPRGDFLNDRTLIPALQKGDVTQSQIDDMVRRILRVMVASGVYDRQADKTSAPTLKPGGATASDPAASAGRQSAVDSPEHRDIARQAATDAIVLLKNERGVLPVDLSRVKSIAVIGPNAGVARTGGGGSSRVVPIYAVSPLEGVQKRAGNTARVVYAAGCGMKGDYVTIPSTALAPPDPAREGSSGLRGEYFANPDLSGTPAATRIDQQIEFSWGRQPPSDPSRALPPPLGRENFSIRWTGSIKAEQTADYTITATADDGMRVFIDDKLIVDAWQQVPRGGKDGDVHLEAGRNHHIRVEYHQATGQASARLSWRLADSVLMNAAVEAAKTSDVALVFAGLSAFYESEGSDRETLALPANQEQLIAAIAQANPRTVVVLTSGAPVVMESWIDRVPAVVETWYAGSEEGNAVATVLFGDRSPSGKLPTTFLKRWEDSPAYGHFPGVNKAVDYAEGVFVGYRHFDRANIEPRFPFGHGLSYTTFAYRDLQVTNLAIKFDLQNTGNREGAEVVQVYVRPEQARVERPVKELKAFRKISLQPGERQTLSIVFDRSAFAYYSDTARDWVVDPGRYQILVGSSSRDVRLTGAVTLK